ncbi:DUF3492 domain-containing protein, partial [Streptomyces chartreusis]|uniref:DUF3492 domain-containing protein n=1 Tax=Streptomyces chartreusis TaxID=1969 RepID=UPI0036A57900
MHVHHGARRNAAARVTLLTEGTYPHSHGGVSVWCDQLVTGMSDIEFDVVAVTGTGREPAMWDLPDHVRSVLSVPMWGAAPEGHPPRGRSRRQLADVYERFLTALVDPGAEDGFAPALYDHALPAADAEHSPVLLGHAGTAILTAVSRRPGLDGQRSLPP